MATPPRRRTATRVLLGWMLVACWLLAIVLAAAHIRIASDSGGAELTDASFEWPGREARIGERDPPAGDVRGVDRFIGGGDFGMVGGADGDGRDRGVGGVGAGGNAKHFSRAANRTAYRLTHRRRGIAAAGDCCIPAALRHARSTKDFSCFGTCFTERACDDPVYPFNSAEEKAMFPASDIEKRKKQLRRRCLSPERMTPPSEWCQNPIPTDRGDRAPAHLVDEIPPAGCRLVSHGGGSGAFQHALVFPSARLAFCGIPKVGITEWEKFLRYYIGAKDYPSYPHAKLDRELLQFDMLDPLAQRRIWEEAGWTWAAFVREPAERLLSAYLDKVEGKVTNGVNGSLSFENFIDRLSSPANYSHCKDSAKGVGNLNMRGLNWCSDPHWRPQVYSCGISERLDRFQFIGNLENAAGNTRELLRHVGLWDSHGALFVHGGVPLGRCKTMSHPANHTAGVGFQQRHRAANPSAATAKSSAKSGHSTGSGGRMDAYYTPGLLRRVREELYADDHRLWRLVSANGGALSTGKDLVSKLSSRC